MKLEQLEEIMSSNLIIFKNLFPLEYPITIPNSKIISCPLHSFIVSVYFFLWKPISFEWPSCISLILPSLTSVVSPNPQWTQLNTVCHSLDLLLPSPGSFFQRATHLRSYFCSNVTILWFLYAILWWSLIWSTYICIIGKIMYYLLLLIKYILVFQILCLVFTFTSWTFYFYLFFMVWFFAIALW